MAHNLQEDRLVQKLVPDPSKGPNAKMLTGFLGKSTQEGYWRLYSTPDLTTYVKFHEDDIIHCEQPTPEQSTLTPTAIWLKRDAEVKFTGTSAVDAQEAFVSGELVNRYLKGTRPEGLPLRGMEGLLGPASTPLCVPGEGIPTLTDCPPPTWWWCRR